MDTTKIIPLGLHRTPDAFKIPAAVLSQEAAVHVPYHQHTYTEEPQPAQPPPPIQTLRCESTFSDGLQTTEASLHQSSSEDEEEDEEHEDTLAFLDDLPSPEDDALLRENAKTTRAIFKSTYPEFERYLIDHKVDSYPNNVGLLVRHFLLQTPRALYVVPVLNVNSSASTSFEHETDDMFLSPEGLRPRSTANPLDDLWEARYIIGRFMDVNITAAPSFLTPSDQIALRIQSTDMHRGLLNHLRSGGVLTDSSNLPLLPQSDQDTLIRLAGYRRARADNALSRSPDRMLEHIMLDPHTLFETFPCFTYYCLLQSQRRPPSTDSYARIVEIVLHTQRTPTHRVVRDLCTPSTVFWMHVLRMTCDAHPRLWAILGAYTPALAAIVSFIRKPKGARPGRDFSTDDVMSCVCNILGADLPEREDDTFTSVSQKIIPPRWSDAFAGLVKRL